ncbi:MAG: helix-turn-helix domain-containing protein [Deltaproteobacteria bacterium]|nr:helix-turn-helix domain-containing protein [Deltaproteobacteria bacterium]
MTSKNEDPSASGELDEAEELDGFNEPIYLASQLASICSVDLKTIHNWCDRHDDPTAPAELESFRTPGGHLRFKHSAVLRFLSRWRYPIPDALLTDRPHVLMVEPDVVRRVRWLSKLGLKRPGREGADYNGSRSVERVAVGLGATLGLFAREQCYVHLYDDAHRALIAVGERGGAGAPIDVVVVRLPLESLEIEDFIAACTSTDEDRAMRFVLVDAPPTLVLKAPILAWLKSDDMATLPVILDTYSREAMPASDTRPEERARGSIARKARVKILPREPLFVASQVAHVWDVDLKTVHNWVERGDIEAFSTPGRHLRFRRRSLLRFLRRYNMTIPAEIAPSKPRVMLVGLPESPLTSLREELSQLFEIIETSNRHEALAVLGRECSGASLVDAIVVHFEAGQTDSLAWLRSVSEHSETRYTSVIAIDGGVGELRDGWNAAGILASLDVNDLSPVRILLERALGV